MISWANKLCFWSSINRSSVACGRVKVDRRLSADVHRRSQPKIDTRVALHRHLRRSLESRLIFDRFIWAGRHLDDYRQTIDQVLIVSIEYRSGITETIASMRVYITCQPLGENRSPETDVRGQVSGSEHISAPNGGYCFMHALIMRAFWLVNQLWFILPLNSKRKKSRVFWVT